MTTTNPSAQQLEATQRILNGYSDASPLPHVITRLSRVISDPKSTMKDFEDVIKLDPILVSRLLRLVNSAFFGLAQTVDSIGRAVAFLGTKNLHNLAVTDALKKVFVAQKEGHGFSQKQLWRHSAAVSICGKLISERIFGLNGDDSLLCGILHDFGLIVEHQVHHDAFIQLFTEAKSTTQLIELERRNFTTDHCLIGYLITADWNMPTAVQEAIRDHHLVSGDVAPESLTGIIQIAEYITAQLGYANMKNVLPDISPPLLNHIQEGIDEYRVLIEDFPEEMNRAEAIYD